MDYCKWLKAVYIIYTMCYFKTPYGINHPLEVWIQHKNLSGFLKHPISRGNSINRVCPLGKGVAVLLAGYILLRRTNCNSTRVANRIIWGSIMLGSLVMNLNVFVYLLPVCWLDLT
jgi:hypothetical protein